MSRSSRLLPSEGQSAVTDTVCSGLNANEADLGWALAIVTRAFRLHSSTSLADLPGGPRGYLVLAAVDQGQPRSQLALAQQLGVDKTVMTYLLDELEGASLVTRRPDPADRRARQVAVTAEGSAALAEFGRRLAEAENLVLAPLNVAERKALRELLGRVANSAQSVGSAPSAESVCLESVSDAEGPC